MSYSVRRKLRKEQRINNNFENILSSLSLEEIIALKLELSTPIVKGKLYGTNIYNTLNAVCRDALIKWVLSVSPSKRAAADFLGVEYSLLKELNRSHKYFEYFEEQKKKGNEDI